LQTVYLQPFNEEPEATIQTHPLDNVVVQPSPKKKNVIIKKLTPKRLLHAPANPSAPVNPASNTRSKKKLQME